MAVHALETSLGTPLPPAPPAPSPSRSSLKMWRPCMRPARWVLELRLDDPGWDSSQALALGMRRFTAAADG